MAKSSPIKQPSVQKLESQIGSPQFQGKLSSPLPPTQTHFHYLSSNYPQEQVLLQNPLSLCFTFVAFDACFCFRIANPQFSESAFTDLGFGSTTASSQSVECEPVASVRVVPNVMTLVAQNAF